jgi:alkylhydroperoxidase family enzyme
MPRVPLGTITSYAAAGENTRPPRLLLAMGHPAQLADAAQELFRVLAQGALSARDRKLATLAIAAELENGYEWGHHAIGAAGLRIPDSDLASIKCGVTDGLPAHDRAVVELALATERQSVTDELWGAAAAELSAEQLVQLTVLSAYYGMLARVQTAMQVDQDPGFNGSY